MFEIKLRFGDDVMLSIKVTYELEPEIVAPQGLIRTTVHGSKEKLTLVLFVKSVIR